MKKVLSFLFLFILFLKIGGYFGMLCIEQEIVREEMVEKIASSLEKADLQTFAFSKEEYRNLEWEKEGKEFWYKNKMYDIVTLKQEVNKMIVSCLNDSKETEIELQLADIGRLENESAPLKNHSKFLVTLIFQKYLAPQHYTFQNNYLNKIEPKPIYQYLNIYHHIALQASFRPPIYFS